MMRKSVFGTGYRTDYAASHDYDLLARICERGKAANLPQVLSMLEFLPDSIGARLAGTQSANAAEVAASVVKKRDPDAEPGLVGELSRMNAMGTPPSRDRSQLRALHARILKLALESFPDDVDEIRRFAAEHVAERRDGFFGSGLREKMLRTCAVVCYYWRWPKSLAYLLLTETLGLKVGGPLEKRDGHA